MKVLISLVFLSLSGWAFAQEKGIRFEKDLSWAAVKDKAKAENKYIFMDVFATWCGPCKQMDADVYSAKIVGAFMNENFVSVKVQADSTKEDSKAVRSWYFDAGRILKEHHVNGFPTYLFFSPEGMLVSRGIGFKDAEEFIQIASEATNPAKQYYSKLEVFKHGLLNRSNLKMLAQEAQANGDTLIARKIAGQYVNDQLSLLCEDKLDQEKLADLIQLVKSFEMDSLYKELSSDYISSQLLRIRNGEEDYSKMLTLAKKIQAFGDKKTAARIAIDYIEHSLNDIAKKKTDKTRMYDLAYVAMDFEESLLAQRISQDYINNYLLKLKESDLLRKDNLKFLSDFMGSEDTKSFRYFMKNRAKIGTILVGLSQPEYKLRSVIAADIPKDLSSKMSFNWDSLEKSMVTKFGSLGKEVINGKKMIYYVNQANWEKFGECYYQYFKTALNRPEYNINSMSWLLFENVRDVKVLTFACDTVMKYAVEEWYQNDPVSWDTYANLLYKTGKVAQAIVWEERAVKMKKGQHDEKLYTNALEKIKKGLPTWKH